MTKIAIASFAIATIAASAFAQIPREPGAEHARLEMLAGRWNIEGESEGDRFTRSETCEWFAGGFHLVCHSDVASPTGPVKGQSIIGYDPDEKVYTFYLITSRGNAVSMKGTVSGAVWTWNGELRVGGEPMKARTTIVDQSPTSYTFRVEGSFNGGPWMVLEEGRGSKVK